jgi:hypothetical protein
VTNRPGDRTEAAQSDSGGKSLDVKVTPRFCVHDVLAHRRISRQLDAVLRHLYPPVERRPSTFGLTDAELRRHANDLHADGWPVEEIQLVLDIEPAS